MLYSLQKQIRLILKDRVYASLNILGLTLGIAAALVLLQYVVFEKSYDTHQQDVERIYRVTGQKIQDGKRQAQRASTSVRLAPLLNEQVPEIEAAVRIHKNDVTRLIFTIPKPDGTEEQFVESKGFHVDGNYFEVFSDRLLQGNPETALTAPKTMVLTESLAQKFFGEQNPIGQVVHMTGTYDFDYEITGVVEDVPKNAHFQYDFLVSLETVRAGWPNASGWGHFYWDFWHTYIKVQPGTDFKELEQKINRIADEAGKEEFAARTYQMDFFLQHLRDIHLYSHLENEFEANGNGKLLSYLLLIAFFILALGWINYINLTTARAVRRAKEVGIRKVVGATRNQLIRQFLGETLIICSLSYILGLSVAAMTTPLVEQVAGLRLDFTLHQQPIFWLASLAFLGFGSILAGAYPAFILSTFRPSKVLKGSFSKSSTGIQVRRYLVLFQFIISFLLITGTFAIFQQVKYLMNRDVGINMEQVLVVNYPNVLPENYWQQYDQMRQELKRNPKIRSVSSSNRIPGRYSPHVELFKQKQESRTAADVMTFIWADYEYMDVFDLEMLAGRDFSEHREDEESVIFNETARRLIGFENPESAVEQPVTWVHSYGELEEMRCIGIVEDYHQDALSEPEPMAFLMNRFSNWLEMSYYLIKIQPGQVEEIIAHVESVYNQNFPDDNFDYAFLDDQFNHQFRAQMQFGKIFSLFSILAILIANIGLVGLSSYMVFQRRKEISIRKVLGATVSNLVYLLSKGYLRLVFLAVILSIPLLFYALNSWLNQFVYRIDINLFLFIIPAGITGFLALLTILFQTIWAAQMNPMHNLKE